MWGAFRHGSFFCCGNLILKFHTKNWEKVLKLWKVIQNWKSCQTFTNRKTVNMVYQTSWSVGIKIILSTGKKKSINNASLL